MKHPLSTLKQNVIKVKHKISKRLRGCQSRGEGIQQQLPGLNLTLFDLLNCGVSSSRIAGLEFDK